jgi:hypothetical protein
MKSIRTRLAAVAAASATLAVTAPISSAGAQEISPAPFPAGGGCPVIVSPSGLGDQGATSNQICGAGLVFIGPAIGQVSSVVGPTIIGGVVNAPVTASAGAVVAGP